MPTTVKTLDLGFLSARGATETPEVRVSQRGVAPESGRTHARIETWDGHRWTPTDGRGRSSGVIIDDGPDDPPVAIW